MSIDVGTYREDADAVATGESWFQASDTVRCALSWAGLGTVRICTNKPDVGCCSRLSRTNRRDGDTDLVRSQSQDD